MEEEEDPNNVACNLLNTVISTIYCNVPKIVETEPESHFGLMLFDSYTRIMGDCTEKYAIITETKNEEKII